MAYALFLMRRIAIPILIATIFPFRGGGLGLAGVLLVVFVLRMRRLALMRW
jgi:hypothetical protein